MAPQRHPRFSEEELRVMVEEIVQVEPQLFGSQVQHTSIARKMEQWRRIIDRVNAVGQHPRTRDDIRKRLNDLRRKVHSGTQANPPPQENQGPGGSGSGSGHTVQGTEEQENRGTGRTAVQQGKDRPREHTLHEALSHHSQETMATVLANFQETQRLQEEHYLGIREELKSINTTLVTIAGVLLDLVNTRRDTVAQQGAPDTSLDDEQPSTSAGASGQEAPPQDHDTSTPHPADGEPPRKQSLRSRNKTENIDKTLARK
ncbi:hypothetical protein NDU88_005000 [Pleurodeles waltl]|uniref:Myb/SANT-like DNA-binding domain-containing protein n=1 Tax=Pleurodeles waltl TaxID=8319 RepID=A0AAV7WX20_PLEWA|nr:hypothetical protein NDU88_005000 [Pleurodeles waltl]